MNTMDDLRKMLFDTIADLRGGKTDSATAKTVAELSQAIINTAKAEADFARATGQAVSSGLIKQAEPSRTITATGQKVVAGHITSHRIAG